MRKKILYTVIDTVLLRYGSWRARSYDIRNTIALASSPRGGSTWLAEMVTSLPGYHMLWEPLHLGNNPHCANYGFTWQNYIPIGTRDPIKQNYLRQIFTGADLSTRTTTRLYLQPLRLLALRGYIVKFVNANMILPWMTSLFPVRTVLMIRHPCAVVASQLRHGAWSHLTRNNVTIPAGLFDDYPHLAQVFTQLQTHEELLAFDWALQTFVPLQTQHPDWLLTTYERLVMSGEAEMERIFAYLQEPVPPAAYQQLRCASATTITDSHVAQGKDPLTGWRNKLVSAQIEAILRVAHAVGVTCYSDELIPDYQQLGID